MSDGGRGRVSLEVGVSKSSQKWSVQRSAVRSIVWLDRCRAIPLKHVSSRRVHLWKPDVSDIIARVEIDLVALPVWRRKRPQAKNSALTNNRGVFVIYARSVPEMFGQPPSFCLYSAAHHDGFFNRRTVARASRCFRLFGRDKRYHQHRN